MERLSVYLLLSMSAGLVQAETNIPGTVGTTPYTPTGVPPDGKGVTSYWTGTGWDNPGVAGCHVEVPKNKNIPRRVFGEECKGNTLVETTPGHAGTQPHAHANDVGNPKLVDCAAWCTATRPGSRGTCLPVGQTGECPTSARCDCK